jgi:hypothetical protein
VSYGGGHAAKLLASQLPQGWRVVAIDRNTHMNRECETGPRRGETRRPLPASRRAVPPPLRSLA